MRQSGEMNICSPGEGTGACYALKEGNEYQREDHGIRTSVASRVGFRGRDTPKCVGGVDGVCNRSHVRGWTEIDIERGAGRTLRSGLRMRSEIGD